MAGLSIQTEPPMKPPYARPLYLLAALALLAPAALAQHAPAERASAHLADQQALLGRLAAAFPSHALDAARGASAEAYVLAERTGYTADDEGFFHLASQSRFVYEAPVDGLRNEVETAYVWEGDDFHPETRTRLVFMTSPPLHLREEREAWDPGAETFVSTGETYNVFGGNRGSYLPTISTRVRREGEVWELVERTLYTVTGDGLQGHYTEGETQQWTGGPMQNEAQFWQPVERFLVEQVPNPEHVHLSDVVYTEQVWEDGAWRNDTRSRFPGFTILELQARVQELMHEAEALSGALVTLRFPDSVQQRWEGETWVTTGRQRTETYCCPYLTTHLIGEAWDAGTQEWLPESLLEIGYEGHVNGSRPVYASLELWDEDEEEFVPFFVEEYEYALDSGRIHRITLGLGAPGRMSPLSLRELTWQRAGGVSAEPGPVAGTATLGAPFPNPATTSTTLTYRLEAAGPVAVRVYDALGRRVATVFEGEQGPGEHPLTFDTSALSSGLYLVRLEASESLQVRRLSVVR
jgi:hypothetical protein